MFCEILQIEIKPEYDQETKSYLLVLHQITLGIFFDCLFVHNLQKLLNPESFKDEEVAEEAPKLFYDDVIQNLTKFLFNPNSAMVETCVKGFSKMILHHRLEDPIEHLAYLMLIWHDKNTKTKSPYSVQFLSSFFNTYSASSLQYVEYFEEAFERLFM